MGSCWLVFILGLRQACRYHRHTKVVGYFGQAAADLGCRGASCSASGNKKIWGWRSRAFERARKHGSSTFRLPLMSRGLGMPHCG